MLKAVIMALLTISLMAVEIKKIDKNTAIIDRVELPLGVSGIVIHNFDKNHSSIVARAILVDKNKIEFEVFDALAQPNLPRPKIKPQINDKVVLEYLYNRALIIAPNFNTYKKVKNEFPYLTFLHPDLFAAELSKEKNPTPTKKDFKNFCNKYSLAKLLIALKNRVYITDCYSFKPVSSFEINTSNSAKFPFYSRIKEIKEGLFSFFKDKKYNYYNYYKELMEVK